MENKVRMWELKTDSGSSVQMGQAEDGSYTITLKSKDGVATSLRMSEDAFAKLLDLAEHIKDVKLAA